MCNSKGLHIDISASPKGHLGFVQFDQERGRALVESYGYIGDCIRKTMAIYITRTFRAKREVPKSSTKNQIEPTTKHCQRHNGPRN